MRTILYIDGFNLYYSAVKDTCLKWLNPVALSGRIFPKNQIIGVKYFTARVKPMPGDPGAPIRQQIYWRALKTIPQCDIIEGDFRQRKTRALVVTPPPRTIEIYKTEEKGSDVNLAAHLLMDAFQSRFECAIVISGDSDLVTPIRMVRDELRMTVGVLNPQRLSGPDHREPRKNAGLREAATFYRNGLSWAQLEGSQFPGALADTNGAFTKPPDWGVQPPRRNRI